MTQVLKNNLKALVLLLLLISAKIQAQSNSKITNTDSVLNQSKNIVPFRIPQVVYANLFGEGNLISINYDRRFKKQNNGWGWHAGFGMLVLPVDDSKPFVEISLPVGINYLIGNKSDFLELGINESIVYDKISQPDGGETNLTNLYGVKIYGKDSYTLWSMPSGTIGYRRQPENSGFCFRVGILPYIVYIDGKLSNSTQSLTGYLSFGYKF